MKKVLKVLLIIFTVIIAIVVGIYFLGVRSYNKDLKDAQLDAMASEVRTVASSIGNYCVLEQLKLKAGQVKDEDRVCRNSYTIIKNMNTINPQVSFISLDDVSDLNIMDDKVAKLVVKDKGYVFTYENDKVTYVKE